MKGAGRNAEIIAEAIEYIQRGLDLLNRVERTAEPISEVMPAQIGPWTCGEDLAYSMVEDAQADLDGMLEHLDAGRGLFAGKRVFSREAEKYLDDLHVKYDDEDLDLDEYPEYDPLVFPGDVPEEDMKIIRALAELEREHIAMDRRIGKIDISDFLRLEQFKDMSDYEFCEWMIKEIGVAAVPGSSFFREPVNNLIRLHFARGKDTLDEALRRLAKLQTAYKAEDDPTETAR
jgi:hypothetical protein